MQCQVTGKQQPAVLRFWNALKSMQERKGCMMMHLVCDVSRSLSECAEKAADDISDGCAVSLIPHQHVEKGGDTSFGQNVRPA